MTPTDIVMETGALSLGDAIDHTRWALRQQAATAFQITTEHGVLVLSEREKADLRQFLAKLLARRLQVLEASY